jgi:hypothetical protein
VGQGPNDIGFVRGLKQRLHCPAELVDYERVSALRRRGTFVRKRDAREIVRHHCRQGADLLVRITDGDQNRPQEVSRREQKAFQELESRVIVGVCDRDIEHWLAIDTGYIAEKLDFNQKELPEDRQGRTGFLKKRINAHCRLTRLEPSEFIEAYVRDTPPVTFRRWLKNHSFGPFYDACVAAAARDDCEVNDERARNR